MLDAVIPEYVVISQRMVQEIVDRSVKRGFRIKDVQIRPPFTGLNLASNEPVANYHLLAEQVEAALYDQTGTPEYPGDYIGLRAYFEGWMFTFNEGAPSPVVWLVSAEADRLIVLCGSARNVLGYSAPDQYTGWRPSSPGGLRGVIAALRQKDPAKLLGYEADDSLQEEMAGDAAWISLGLRKESPEIEMGLDVLLRPYVYVEDYAASFITEEKLAYDRVIVGAPLWARAISGLPPPGTK